ncbi:hypothetical protein [Mesorhizobium sp.]|uniref:hypothetical protein n=1 Tax=Mesorhizobium sp. TaxID=1871066 RepID=UPI0034377BF7
MPGDPDDTHSRYLEAEIDDLVVGCIYLTNGNPAPGYLAVNIVELCFYRKKLPPIATRLFSSRLIASGHAGSADSRTQKKKSECR